MFRTLATLSGIALAINVIEQMVCGKSNPAIPNNSDKSNPVDAGKSLNILGTHDGQVVIASVNEDGGQVPPTKSISNKGRAEYEEAIADFNETIKLKPKFPETYYNRGNAKSDLGKYAEAIEDYTKAIKLKPNYPKAYSNRGSAKGNMGNFTSAINDFNDAIKLDPDLVSAYIGRGVANTSLGKYDEARANLRKALELEPGNELAKRALAKIEAMGKND